MARYEPLTAALLEVAERGQQTFAMSFRADRRDHRNSSAAISTQRQWWANADHSQAVAWREADFHVEQVDLDRKQVRFARGPVGGTRAEPKGTETGVTEEAELHAGDSAEQRRAEGLMLELYQQGVGRSLQSPYVLRAAGGARMEFDGGCEAEGQAPGILLEAWAHQGPPKAAQKKKIVGDALNGVWGDVRGGTDSARAAVP